MKFYAYIPNDLGKEPVGTADRMLFELKTVKGAINRVNTIAKFKEKGYRLFTYTNFYDDKTFNLKADTQLNKFIHFV